MRAGVGAIIARHLSPGRLLALAGLLVACSASSPSDPDGFRTVHLVGQVSDPEGGPISGIQVTWEAWPAPDPQSLSVHGAGRTDDEGRFAAKLGDYDRTVLDSLAVAVGGTDCWGFAPLELVDRRLEVRPGSDTVANLDLTLERTAARGRLAVGTICVAMVVEHVPELKTEDHLTLWIDEVGDSVHGRWDITYDESRGDDWGHFSGALEGSTLVLALRHDEPWETCTGYTMEIPIDSGNWLGVGSHGSEGCPHTPVPLRFVEGAHREWPFD
jgi:hypothetical protein